VDEGSTVDKSPPTIGCKNADPDDGGRRAVDDVRNRAQARRVRDSAAAEPVLAIVTEECACAVDGRLSPLASVPRFPIGPRACVIGLFWLMVHLPS
jgi:hypothetical protein